MSYLLGNIIQIPQINPSGVATQAAPTAYEMYVALQNQLVMWQLVSALLGVLLVVAIVLFMPFIPWLMSKMFTKKTLIFLMDKTRNVKFNGSFQLRNGMYHSEKLGLYFVKKYSGVFYLYGVPFDICNIDLGFVQHPIYNKFIAELRKSGYKNWKSLETALELNSIPEGADGQEMVEALGYNTLEEAYAKLNPLHLTTKSEILAPYFSSCPLDELIGYGADVPPASIQGEVDDAVHSQKNPEMASALKQYLPMAIFILIVLVGGALAYKMIS
jgi:hypothetical protein